MCNFAPVAPEASVYGVCRPGHLGGGLEEWTATVAGAGVDRVVCLLSSTEATRWGLPDAYADRFETAHVPIRDRHLPKEVALRAALGALRDADDGESVALHCNAGLGRTGVVAAAWLTRDRGYDPREAIEAVAEAGRAPREAVRCGNATEAELLELLTP
ncbi:dual specificity protein phosphatase family protein [Natronomonas gomsonensis]|uniref:protein-tyrosine phosphatase family protein n=1 Tax=Natronomonas gomsonensis TaxID=1046043 RepID=UPI0015C0175B|nr:dual specificity protein phosphatase family protein [Natronomonas gomsonensis]